MKTKINDKIKHYYQDHLYRNASYLILNAVVTEGIGFVFWMIAAKFYSDYDVGLGATMFSAIMLIMVLSTFGFTISYVKFIPQYINDNKKVQDIINVGFAVAGIINLLLVITFILLIPVLSPKLGIIREDFIYILFFIVFSIIWVINILFNSVFIGYRQASYTFIRNLFLNVTRVVIIVIPVIVSFGAFGILGALCVAGIISIVVSFYLLRKLNKDYTINIDLNRKWKLFNEMFHFSFGNYVAILFQQSPILILPLMITQILSPEITAYFYITWMIAAVLFMFAVTISQSLLAEGSYDDKELFKLIIKAVKFTFLLLIPGIIGLLLIGNQILSFFGEGYVEHGLYLLYLLTASSILYGINIVYITIKNIKKEIKDLVVVNGIIAGVTLLTAYLFLESYGISVVGMGWIIGNLIVVLIAIVDFRKEISGFIKNFRIY